ncbi:uncharacterized protein [Nicotiana sylvestris]|uniref:uncharacterized protein n=1 Tax=Nicotiana sylvestris TaxID=4096 RepID=UPI00388C4849
MFDSSIVVSVASSASSAAAARRAVGSKPLRRHCFVVNQEDHVAASSSQLLPVSAIDATISAARRALLPLRHDQHCCSRFCYCVAAIPSLLPSFSRLAMASTVHSAVAASSLHILRENPPKRTPTVAAHVSAMDEQALMLPWPAADCCSFLSIFFVSNALQAFTNQLPVAPLTPTTKNNTLENPHSGLVNSGCGGTPNESRDGEPETSQGVERPHRSNTWSATCNEMIDMDKYSQQSWKPSAAPLPISKKFKMPDIPKYDGTTDPRDHVVAFTTSVKGNDLTKQEIESVLVKKFGEILTKRTLTWYYLLPKNSIDSFIRAHSGAQKVEKRMEDIFKIKQGDMELLREFVDRFQRERKMLPRVPDNWAAMAYNTKLRIEDDTITQSRKEERVSSRCAETEKSSSKNRYEPYMGPEGRDSRSKQDNSWYDHRSKDRESGSSSRFGKERNTREMRDDNRSSKAKIGGYNFNVSTLELVAILRSMGDKVRWPKEMRSNPSRRNPDFWCEFHNDHGHKTADCRLLQDEVEHLLKQGYLIELFSEKGKQTYMKNMQESPKPPSPKRTVNVISGGEEINDVTYTAAKKVSKIQSHTKSEFDSSVNIILLRVVNEMQANNKLIPKTHTLFGFDNSSVVTKGEIILTTFAEGVVKDTKFQVVEMDMTYNMILGRPWIHEMDVVPSTIHQVIKFPSQWGIRQIRGDQQASRNCFAWSHSDMTGVLTEVITRKLNEDPSYPPVKQKKRKQSSFKNHVIQDAVQKLLKIRSIREVKYPDWLAKYCGHKLLSFLDAYSGYNQIKMNPLDEEKTSFITNRETYYYKVMSFGLKNVGATYQRLTTKMFQENLGKTMEVYIDDMLVKPQQTGDHIQHLTDTFQIFRKFNMKLNPEKCAFDVSSALKKQNQFEWSEECQQALKNLKSYLSNPPLLAKPKDREKLLVYLVVSEVAGSAVLVQEDQGKQSPIYYVGKSLLDAETRYPHLEKLALALIMASRKLRPYFQCHLISVVTAYPLRNILHKQELSGRLAKWAIELSEFDILYQPRTAIKSQVLADFVADFSQGIQLEAEKELQVFNESNPGTWTLFTNGSSNVKGAGLELARELGIEQVIIKSDSQLVVNQMQGTYTTREVRMQQYLEKARDLVRQFQTWKVMQIPREENAKADALANLASAVDVTNE